VCYLKVIWDSVQCALSVCVVLCHEGVLQSDLLYLQPLICCSVTLTTDAKDNWCVVLNISHLLQKYFVWMLHVRERERDRQTETETEREIALAVWPLVQTYYSNDLPHPPADLCPGSNPGSDTKENAWSPALIWMMWLCCAVISHLSIYSAMCSAASWSAEWVDTSCLSFEA